MITFSRLGHYGQFGNQLWQYALLRAVAHRHGYEIAIPQNHTLPKKQGMYELKPLSIRARQYYPVVDKIRHRCQEEWDHVFRERYLTYQDGTDFCGYFQNWRYTEYLPPDFRDELLPNERLAAQVSAMHKNHRQDSRRLVAVNVRRSDYLTLGGGGYHLVLPPEWYAKSDGRIANERQPRHVRCSQRRSRLV